ASKELERFTTEASAQASIHHANVQQLYQVGSHNGRPYLVLELPEGLTLEQRLKRQPMVLTDKLELMDTLAKTVYFCHCWGVIHGNLTPSNIMLSVDRGLKITGFDFSCHYSELECKKGFLRAPTSSSFIPPEQAVTSVRDTGPAKDICA